MALTVKTTALILIFFMMTSFAIAKTHKKKHPKPKATPTHTVRLSNPVDAPD